MGWFLHRCRPCKQSQKEAERWFQASWLLKKTVWPQSCPAPWVSSLCIPPAFLLFFSQASLPPFLPLFSFHKAGAGSLWLTMSIEHWSCLNAVGYGLGTTPQVLSRDRLALLIQARAWHQGVSTERGKKGEDFLHLGSPLEGTCHLVAAAGTVSGDFFYSAA